MAKITGIVKILVAGDLQRTVEDAELDLGGYKREAVVGHKVYGPKDSLVPSSCKFKVAHTSDTDLIALKNTVDATLIFECDTGVSYIVTNAFVAETLKLSGGIVDVEMQGDPADEG